MDKSKIKKIFFSMGGGIVLGLLAFAYTQQNDGTEPKLEPQENLVIRNKYIVMKYYPNQKINTFELVFSNVSTDDCNHITITSAEKYGFVDKDEIFRPGGHALMTQQNNDETVRPGGHSTSMMPQYGCRRIGEKTVRIFSLPQKDAFRPWVDHFKINFGENDSFDFHVESIQENFAPLLLTRNPKNNLDTNFVGCGLEGTVLQRVYDCSKKIKNYAVYINENNAKSKDFTVLQNGKSKFYTLFENNNSAHNPDLFWFLVACPPGPAPQTACHWLTPVVPEDNPALDPMNTHTKDRFPTFQFNMLTGYQKRLLFSGQMTNEGNGYTFEQANGFLYNKNNNNDLVIYADIDTNPGTIPENQIPKTARSICNATENKALIPNGVFSSKDASVRDIVSFDSGANIKWQMPSYPMYNILAGGTPVQHEFEGNPIESVSGCSNGEPFKPELHLSMMLRRQNCNYSLQAWRESTTKFPINQGFSATNVPGFFSNQYIPPVTVDAKTAYLPDSLWSSSTAGTMGGGITYTVWTLSGSITLGKGPQSSEPEFQIAGFAQVATTESSTFSGGKKVDVDFTMNARCVALSWY